MYTLNLRCSQRPDPQLVNTENILEGCHGIIFSWNDIHLAWVFTISRQVGT